VTGTGGRPAVQGEPGNWHTRCGAAVQGPLHLIRGGGLVSFCPTPAFSPGPTRQNSSARHPRLTARWASGHARAPYVPSACRISATGRRAPRRASIGLSVIGYPSMVCSRDGSSSVRRPPASADRPGAAVQCPRAARRRRSDPVRPSRPVARLGYRSGLRGRGGGRHGPRRPRPGCGRRRRRLIRPIARAAPRPAEYVPVRLVGRLGLADVADMDDRRAGWGLEHLGLRPVQVAADVANGDRGDLVRLDESQVVRPERPWSAPVRPGRPPDTKSGTHRQCPRGISSPIQGKCPQRGPGS